jgi:ADP-ribose pyrophosphatase
MSYIEAEPTVSTVTVFSGRLIEVQKVTVKLPNGSTTDREIVEHPEVIAVLPLLDDGRVVLVRQFRKAAEKVLLEVPAGGVEAGESPEDAVRREMIEETGYRVGSVKKLTSFYTSPGFTTELMHLYEARGLEAGNATEETDQIEVVLLTPEEALKRVESDDVADAKTLLALKYAAAQR